jgi:hypothetical protein
MREKENNDGDVGSIPFSLSLNDLMRLYDRLLTVLNSPVVIPSAFSKLRLVCSLIHQFSFRMSAEQRDTVESTCRRSHLLEILLVNDDRMMDDVVASSFWIPVEIVNVSPLGRLQEFEWKYRYLSDATDGSDNDENPIVTISKEELIEEEALLMQMAHTPIPTEAPFPSNRTTGATTNKGSFHLETIQHRIRDLWGERTCQQKVEQLRQSNRETIAK